MNIQDGSLRTVKNPFLEEKPKRKVTMESKWCHTGMIPLDTLVSIRNNENTDIAKLTASQMSKKIAGYKAQDIEKGLYDSAKIVNLPFAVQLLIECGCKCHYCEKDMQLLYDLVREPMQWSLDRIDNAQGHNTGNVYAACLACNLRRKTIQYERYFSGKQLKWNKQE